MEDYYTIQTDGHHSHLFCELHTLQKQGALCDVILAAEDGEVMAHKVVLMAVSKFFREKLSPVVSTVMPRISLKGTSVVELANLVKYMYTGKLLVSKDTMDVTLEIAEVLGLQGIVEGYQDIITYEHMKQTSHSGLIQQSADKVGVFESVPDPVSLQQNQLSDTPTDSSPQPAVEMNIDSTPSQLAEATTAGNGSPSSLHSTTQPSYQTNFETTPDHQSNKQEIETTSDTGVPTLTDSSPQSADQTKSNATSDHQAINQERATTGDTGSPTSSNEKSLQNKKGKSNTDWTITEFRPDGTSVTYTVCEADEAKQDEVPVQTSTSDYNFQFNPYDEQYMNVSVGTEAAQPGRQVKQDTPNTSTDEQMYNVAEEQTQPQEVLDEQAQHQDLLTVAIETLSGVSAQKKNNKKVDPSEDAIAVQNLPGISDTVQEEPVENGKIVETKIVTLSAGKISNELGGQTSVYTVALDPSTIRQPLKMPRVLRRRTEKEKQAEIAAKKYRKKKAELLNSQIELHFPNLRSNKQKKHPRILMKAASKVDRDTAVSDADTAHVQHGDDKEKADVSSVNVPDVNSLEVSSKENCEDFAQVVNFDIVETVASCQLHGKPLEQCPHSQSDELFEGNVGKDRTDVNQLIVKPVTRSVTKIKERKPIEDKQKPTIRVTSRHASEMAAQEDLESSESPKDASAVVKIHVPSTVSRGTKVTAVGTKHNPDKSDFSSICNSLQTGLVQISPVKNIQGNIGEKSRTKVSSAEKVDSEPMRTPASVDSVRSSAAKRKGKVPRRLSLSADNTAKVKVPIVRTRQNSRSEERQKSREEMASVDKKKEQIESGDTIRQSQKGGSSLEEVSAEKDDICNETNSQHNENVKAKNATNAVVMSAELATTNIPKIRNKTVLQQETVVELVKNRSERNVFSVDFDKSKGIAPIKEHSYISDAEKYPQMKTRSGTKRKASNEIEVTDSKRPNVSRVLNYITKDASLPVEKVSAECDKDDAPGRDQSPNSKLSVTSLQNESLFSKHFKKWVEESLSNQCQSEIPDDGETDTATASSVGESDTATRTTTATSAGESDTATITTASSVRLTDTATATTSSAGETDKATSTHPTSSVGETNTATATTSSVGETDKATPTLATSRVREANTATTTTSIAGETDTATTTTSTSIQTPGVPGNIDISADSVALNTDYADEQADWELPCLHMMVDKEVETVYDEEEGYEEMEAEDDELVDNKSDKSVPASSKKVNVQEDMEQGKPDGDASEAPKMPLSKITPRAKKLKTYQHKGKLHCGKCDQIFPDQQSLVHHLFVEHMTTISRSLKRLECPQCSFVAVTFKEIDAHLETHEGSKLVACTKCEKTFRTYLDLKKHLLIHTEKSIQCDQCSFTTRQAASLRTHVKLRHSKTVDEHSCKFCLYKSRLLGNLRKHLLAAHDLIVVTKQSKENRRKYAEHEEGTLLMKDGSVYTDSKPLPKMSIRNFNKKEKIEVSKKDQDSTKRKRGLNALPYEEFTKELMKRHEQYLKEPQKDFKVMTKNLAIATAHPSFPQSSPSVRNTRATKVYNGQRTGYQVTCNQVVIDNQASSYPGEEPHEDGQYHVIASEVEVTGSDTTDMDNIVIQVVQEDGEVHQDEMQQVIAITENTDNESPADEQLLVINSEGKQSLIRTEDFYKSLMSKGGMETSQTLEMITALLQAGEQIEIQQAQAEGDEIQNA